MLMTVGIAKSPLEKAILGGTGPF
ncbi:MAG: hypothetical protein JWO82_1282, partial [Akkermansiaceae bacterium]|nr:hypothetical protein [Akkermansiaceae bacterium]